MTIVIKGYKTPNSMSSGLYKGPGMIDDSVPIGVLSVNAVRVCKPVQSKSNADSGQGQFSPPGLITHATIGANHNSNIMVNKITHNFNSVSGTGKIT